LSSLSPFDRLRISDALQLESESLRDTPVIAQEQVLSERVYRAILQMLDQGTLRRVALLRIGNLFKDRLAATGLIVHELRKGYRIAPPLTSEQLKQLMDARRLIEIGAIEHACGNFIRLQQPIEPWESMAIRNLPFANCSHVKNCARAENPNAGIYLTSPATLATGLIDCRRAIAFAIALGFRGALLSENYGGDGLSVPAENKRYLTCLLGHIGRPDSEVGQ
jgi:hypothetical protein